ncbi:MAG: SDR family oxidoreductase [Planctomycetota bacterium]
MPGSCVEELFSLKGKAVVIPGGGGTLGSSMGAAFARAGAQVALWDVREDALADKKKRLAEACGDAKRIHGVRVDLMREESIEAAREETVRLTGDVHILLNACGGNRGKCAMVDQKVEDYDFVLKLNLLAGCFLPMKAFAKYWIREGIRGCVINIASMAGFVPLSGVWAYDAAKAAVINQTHAAAREFAPHGIRVNAIAPGFFLADQNRALLVDEKTGEPTARGREVLARTPFGRFGEPDELSGVVLFLASERAAGFVSGAVIPVDGAYLCNNI